MSEEEMILDYPRLKLEYTRLHEDYRRLQSKLKAVEDSLNSTLLSMGNYSDLHIADQKKYVEISKVLNELKN